MKIPGYHLLAGLMLLTYPTQADLIFSEYVEGSSNNKALEILNTSDVPVELSTYEIQIFFNGNVTAGTTIPLSGTLDSGSYFLVADDSAAQEILDIADIASPRSFFNGDDLILLLNNDVVVDSIGQFGFDPGSAYSANGVSTQNSTLRRKSSVTTGDSDQTDAYDPSIEWDSFPNDTFDDLTGSSGNGGGGDPEEPPPSEVSNVYFSEYVEGSSNNKALEIYNAEDEPVDLSAFTVQIYFNGNNSAGQTISLSGSLESGATYVVANTNSSSEIIDVANQTSGSVAFNGDDAIVLRQNGEIVDSIGQVGFDPGSQWGSGETSTQNNTIRRLSSVTNGDRTIDDVFDPSVEWEGFAQNTFDDLGCYGICEDEPEPITAAFINEIQGSGFTSPLDGMNVVVEAIVVGDFQNNNSADNGQLRGFFLQEEDSDADADLLTSEGLFVFDNAGTVNVNIGDKVQVTGEVSEFNGMTQISAAEVVVIASNEPLPTAATATLPNESFENVEGMSVILPQTLVISDTFNYGRFGELGLSLPLSGEQIPMIPTAVELPGSVGFEARSDANNSSRIILDDGLSSQNPDVLKHPNGMPFGATNLLRSGDTIQGTSGVMNYAFGAYRILATGPLGYAATNPRPAAPMLGTDISIVSFNVLNYFTTLDERGADSAAEFERQRTKIIQALVDLDADVVGLIEIENNTDALDDLVLGLNESYGSDTYAKISTGIIGDDAIKVAFIYKHESVEAIGNHAILDSSVDPRFDDSRNRPALAQTFMSLTNAGKFTVTVNHLKSKGSGCSDGSSSSDGQGNCSVTRANAAAALVDWLATDPTDSGDEDHLIIGDLNAYDKEDAITVITSAGYTDLVLRDNGEFAYSFVFRGEFGYLDHALANDSMTEQSVADVWHINADEVRIFDYNVEFGGDAYYEPNAFRSSDHDPIVVGVNPAYDLSDVLDYVLLATSNGTLVGVNSAKALNGYAQKLITAVKQETKGNLKAVCTLVTVNEKLSDGNGQPSDVVTGLAQPIVNNMLNNYLSDNCQ